VSIPGVPRAKLRKLGRKLSWQQLVVSSTPLLCCFLPLPQLLTPQYTVQIGWKVALPGRVWGDYARDRSTKAWARKHSKDVFNSKVIAFKRGVHGEVLFTVKFADETPFEISYAHLWPHLLPVHRIAILHLGGTEPKAACQSEPKKRGRRPSPIPPVLAEEEAETATADMEEHEQEEQLEYGANAADIAADNMAAIVAQQCDQYLLRGISTLIQYQKCR
jgi:hypothetical protein